MSTRSENSHAHTQSDKSAASTSTPNFVQRRRQPTGGYLRAFTRVLPNLMVITLLAGVGYYGHHHGWQLPKFSELAGPPQLADAVWCAAHGVPEADCIACNAELMPKGELYGWCAEHGVHECVLDHPKLAQLPESPDISAADLQRANRALSVRSRAENDPGCKLHLRRIQFASREAAEKAGIDIRLVDRGPIIEMVPAAGEIIYDPTRVAHLSSRAAGNVWRVLVQVGQQVLKGDVLAVIDAVDVGRAKTELLEAIAQLRLLEQTVDRLHGLDGDVIPGKLVLEAEADRAKAVAAVRKWVQVLQNFGLPISTQEVLAQSDDELLQRLHGLGLPTSMQAELDDSPATANLIPIVAPRDGTIVVRDVVAGEVVSTEKRLFTVADTQTMWLMLDVPLEDIELIAHGQSVEFQADGTDHLHRGTINWISTAVDAETRTVKVRGELPNEDGSLRNETFGTGNIILRHETDAIVAPSSAIHWEGCCHVAFVRDKDWFTNPYQVIHTRSVRPGVVANGMTEIIAGLWPGEVVVTEGSGVLRAELLKGNLGAG